MVKLLFLCRRRSELTPARYATLLLEGHVPLALRHHPTMRRYAVNIVEETVAGAPPIDSVGALWFDTLADFQERLYDSADGERVIARDVAGFLAGADAYVTREYVLRAPPRGTMGSRTPGAKLVVCLVPPPDTSRDTFVREWFERRAQAVLASPGIRGYVANVVDDRLAQDAPAYAGIAEIHVDELQHRQILALHGPTIAGYRVAEYVQR